MSNQSSFKRNRLGILAMAMLGCGFAIWISHCASAAPSDNQDGVPTAVAGVAKVTREDLFQEVQYLAEFRPYQEVELHAKVSGFVSQMNVDFGDKVKAGQLLATLEVPELQADLDRAEAAAMKAEADYTNAHLIYTRLLAVNSDHPNLVAQQELDTAAANDQSTAAAIAGAKADAEKYQTLVDYTKITAPFDGVVTRRYVDPGALIQAGTSSETRPLLRVSDNYRLRLDFPVTVDFVKDIQVGAPVEVNVKSLNGKEFTGKISRFTDEVSAETRKMTTEIEVTNQDLQLVPGMYANVTLKLEKHAGVLSIPIEAVNIGKNPTVLVVNHNNEIEERTITTGVETPDKYEVLSGVQEGDLVVVGNRAAFQAGQKVEPKLVQVSLQQAN
jgi:RND family efflux transporter MFP subunit